MKSFIKSMCLCAVMCSMEVLGATLTVPAQYPTIQAAIGAADPNEGLHTIIVSPGTYIENINFYGKNIILTSTDPGDPTIVESTIIDGNQNGSVVTFSGDETPECKIRGFTITNGYASNYDGGGLYGNQTRAAIEYCTISDNRASNGGGGLYDCSGSISNCIISSNTAGYGGGLFLCYGSISNCMISSNTAASWGGGLDHCGALITNCTISGNTASYFGGGLYNCDGPITNCTITGNTAEHGGGLSGCDGLITNCIIWGNNAPLGAQLYSSLTPTYSCIQDWSGGTGNVNSNPLFADSSLPDPADWDLHLQPASPCIDTGTNTPPGGLPPTDIEGLVRPIDGNNDNNLRADIGAYEFFEYPNEPYIHIWPQSLSLTRFEAGSNPEDQSLSIKNLGIQPLNWSIDTTSKPAWLTVTQTSGTLEHEESEDVILSIDITGLSGGQYSYTFEVADPAAQNSPQTITVELDVIGPILEVSQTSFSFTALEGGSNPNTQTLTITNPGGGTLNWSIVDVNSVSYLPPDWLTITPTSGTLEHEESEDVILSIDITGLSGGQYSYSFEVSDPAVQNSPQTITVDLEVIGPILDVSQTSFSFSVFEGFPNPDPRTLTISNPGGGTLNWSADLIGKPDWLSVTPTSGSLGHDQSEYVTLSIDITGLSGGQYSYSFEVSDPAAQNSPQTITVDLEVIGPILDVSQTDFSFTAFEGESNSNDQTLTISNHGGGILNWSIVDVNSISFLPPDWLIITPTSGVLDPNTSEQITISTDISNLSGGQYSYSFEVSDPAAQNSPQTITVDLEVIGPILDVSQTDFSFTAPEDGSDPNSQILTISNAGGGILNWSIPDANLIAMPDWLSITSTNGTLGYNQSDEIILFVDAAVVSNGGYSYSFQISDPAAQNSPQTMFVYLRVGGIHVPGTYPTIQAAIDAAVEGDTIIVSPGTYYENINFNGKNVILTSTNPEDPNVVENTIIDGNLNGPVITFSGSETPACTLRGFTITNGGNGIFGNHTQATIANSIITYNNATSVVDPNFLSNNGGGLHQCDGLITNCLITHNTAYYDGGGLYKCNGIITNCTISNNETTYFYYDYDPWDGTTYIESGRGGGLANCEGTINNCIIYFNSTRWYYHQLYSCSTPTFSCIEDWTGGGTGNINSDPLFADVPNDDYHLKSEYGRWEPPETILNDNGTPTDPNDDFWEVVSLGQWVYDTLTSPCIDAGDPASDWTAELWPHGGRINMGAYGGTPQASMSGYFVGNPVDVDHDEVVTFNDFSLFAQDWQKTEYLLDTDFDLNGIVDINDLMQLSDWWLWQQGPIIEVSKMLFSPVGYEAGPNPESDTLTISNSGKGILNWSIDLTDKPAWLIVSPTSGSVEEGQTEDVTLQYDITGLSIGGYSYTFDVSDPLAINSPREITVHLGIGNLINVPGDVASIQAAIDLVSQNGTIIVSPGTYYENILFPGRDFILTSTNPEDPNIVDSTIIDGMNNGRVITMAGSETSSCQIRGFTVTHGYTSNYAGGGLYGNAAQAAIEYCKIINNTSANGNNGGGLSLCDGAISNCTISDNTARLGGGLSYCDGAISYCTISGNTAVDSGYGIGGGLWRCNAVITNCTISGNTTDYHGGGLDQCNGRITNCMITGNTANYGGGFAYCDGSITNCMITGNTAHGSGGGLYYCGGWITNCTIAGNTAHYNGGGLHNYDGSITNCTITGNTAQDHGGGLYYSNGSITNCIIWSNISWQHAQLAGSSTPTYSCIQDWTGGGTGNIISNPMFTNTASPDPSLWDLHLLPASPCIDTGTNTPPGGLPATDIEGNPRTIDGDSNGSAIVDMGAYEYVP